LPAGLDRLLARQFSRPQGPIGRLFLGPLLNRIGARMMREAFDALDVRAGETVLDLGFGGGALADRLLASDAAVVGVDRSAAMVQRACRRHASAVAAGRARFLQGSAQALPLADASLDKAASVNALYFWPDLAAVMRELARVLKPGGRLVLGFQTEDAVRSWPGHVHGFFAWPDACVEKAVEDAGMPIASVRHGFDPRVRDFRTLVARKA